MTDYEKGFLDGLETYAHMKDSSLYVGTTGMTLKAAKETYKRAWNFNPPVPSKPT